MGSNSSQQSNTERDVQAQRHLACSTLRMMLTKREALALRPTQRAALPWDEIKRQWIARCLPQDLSTKCF